MPKGNNQKFKLYRLAQIMQEQTDDEHYITMPEIMKSLAQYEVTADRKSIYADLRDLSVLGVEVKIMGIKQKTGEIKKDVCCVYAKV